MNNECVLKLDTTSESKRPKNTIRVIKIEAQKRTRKQLNKCGPRKKRSAVKTEKCRKNSRQKRFIWNLMKARTTFLFKVHSFSNNAGEYDCMLALCSSRVSFGFRP